MKTIKNISTELYKKNLGAKIGYSFTFSFFVLATFVLAWFLPETLIITVPLFIIPLFYGLQLACADVNNGFPYRLKSLFVGYKLYFSPKGFGAYSILMGLLKALGVYVGFNMISTFVLVPVYMGIDPEFMNYINQFNKAKFEEIPQIIESFVQSQGFINLEFVASSVSLFFGLYMFLHHIMSNSIKAEMSFYTPNTVPMQSNKIMHKLGFRAFRRLYYKDYYSNLWPMIVLYVLGFVGGCVLGYFVLSTKEFPLTGYQVRIIALAIILVINIPFLSYFCDVMESLYKRHAKDYEKASVNGIMDNLEEILKDKSLSEEEKTLLQELMKKKEENKQNTADNKSDDKK